MSPGVFVCVPSDTWCWLLDPQPRPSPGHRLQRPAVQDPEREHEQEPVIDWELEIDLELNKRNAYYSTKRWDGMQKHMIYSSYSSTSSFSVRSFVTWQ